MKATVAFLAGLGLLWLQSFAQDAKPSAQDAKKIGAGEAVKYYEQQMTVTGKVAQVTIAERAVFLNLDGSFPNTPFTAVIFSTATNNFGDLSKLQGQDVEITGKISGFTGKPQIVLTSTNQLTVVTNKAGDGK